MRRRTVRKTTQRLRFKMQVQHGACVPQPNKPFNADTNKRHRFAIFKACVGNLGASRLGAG